MNDFVPPLDDIRFTLDHIADLGDVTSTEHFKHVDAATIHDVTAEVGRFMAEVVAPTNRDGDTIMAQWNDGVVTTPESFAPAYRGWVESGFGAMPFDPEFGGAGFPWSSAVAVQDLFMAANVSLSLCPLLTQGAIDAIEAHGSAEQKATYLPKMLTGEWSGTMNLTEPQAGSDVGAVTAKAEPRGDGSYAITGQKIYITFGDHDLVDQIVHLVLARTPGSPPGTKGISMFLVPKFLLDGDGSLADRNDVSVISIEHKLGIHGSPTCVMQFDGATGWLVGDEHAGMRNMFTMMNNARLSVGLQGVAITERALQQAVQYSQDRQQGTAVGADKSTSSPIIEHPDVRRMLMTQRAWLDGLRALVYTNAAALDRATASNDTDEATRWRELADLLIPLSKGLSTEVCNGMTSLAVQVHGGMGYIEETGVAQHYRDARIFAIYEGTNGIQAADLVGRKLAARGGGVIHDLLDDLAAHGKQLADIDGLGRFAEQLDSAVAVARAATDHLLTNGPNDLRSLLGASGPYLQLLGTTVVGGLLAKGAVAASNGVDFSDEFKQAKVVSAKFFGEQILPTVHGLLPAVQSTADDLFALTPAQF